MGPSDSQEELTVPLLEGSVQPHPAVGRLQGPATRGQDEDLPAGGGDEEAQQAKPVLLRAAGVTWIVTTFLMLGDMFGLGTLTLPADFARMGWAPGAATMLLCAVGTLYSGRLFTLLAAKVPNGRVFDDYGYAAMGRLGRRLVYATVYLTIAGEPVIFHLTCMEALRQTFYKSGLSQLAAGGIVAAIMLPLAQVRELEEVSGFSLVGIAGMLLAVLVAVGKLLTMHVEDYTPTEWVHRPESMRVSLVAVMDIVFTYGGQVNWVRYVTSMATPSHFPRSVAATNGFMTAAYILMGAVGYYKLGQTFDQSQPVTSILPQDAWTVAMNAGLLVHCLLAYQINVNVWVHLAQHFVAPSMNWPEHAGSTRGRLSWLCFSCVAVAYSFAVATTFPFFSTVMAIIASLGDLAGAYTLPALFVLALVGPALRKEERWLCYVVIPLTLALSAWGVVSSIMQLVHEFSVH